MSQLSWSDQLSSSHLKTVMVPNQNTSDCPSMETSGDKGPTLARWPLRLDRASMYSGALSHSLVHSPFHMDQITEHHFPSPPRPPHETLAVINRFFFFCSASCRKRQTLLQLIFHTVRNLTWEGHVLLLTVVIEDLSLQSSILLNCPCQDKPCGQVVQIWTKISHGVRMDEEVGQIQDAFRK